MVELDRNSYLPFKDGVIGEKLGEGSHSVVHALNSRIGKKDYLVKVGQTKNWQPPLFRQLKFNVPRKLASRLIVGLFNEPGLNFYPTVKSIKRAFREEYGLIKQYFGSESEKAREELLQAIMNPESAFYRKMQKIIGSEEGFKLMKDVVERHRDDNFLKNEQIVIGLPPDISREKVDRLIARAKHVPVTYYILQEQVEGRNILPVAALKDEDLRQRPDLTKRLLMFCLLQRKMYEDTGKIVDTRAEELGRHPMEWFQKTHNILIDMNKNQPYFIDTRFVGNRRTRFGIGLLVDVLSKRSVDRAIKKYTKILTVSKI